MDVQKRFKRWFKLRFAILYPFGIFVLLFANCDDKSISVGIWFIITGLLIRTWANGYAIKTEKLTTSGPYAFVRHPLYLGTAFLTIGFIIMLKIYYFGILFAIVMATVYYRTIKNEEMVLENRFKESYGNYRKRVPAIFPAIFSYAEGEKWPFSFRRLIKSQEYKLVIWITVLVIIFRIKQEIMLEHKTISAGILRLIIIAFLLGLIDLIGEVIRHKLKKSI